MCKSKKCTEITHSLTPKSHRSSRSSFPTHQSSLSLSTNYSSSSFINQNSTSFSSSSISSKKSLKNLKDTLPEQPKIYDFVEICRATNNFLSRPLSSSSSSTSWRCQIRGKDVILIQRKFRRIDPIQLPELQQRLSTICRSHHSSLIKLLGAATSGNYIYLVYEFINGANLATCLRNPKNPNFTVLSNWVARMQIATDIAHGLDYIHHCTGSNSGFVHNHIKCSSIIVAQDSLNAKICHFGTAELCGEVGGAEKSERGSLDRSNSGGMKIEGTRGYMPPELQETGVVTQKSDVYAFGVVVLELVSGEEALKYVFDEGSGVFRRVSVIEKAREVVVVVADGGGSGVRSWVDRRLRDSYPVDVAEKMLVLGLECVEEEPVKRPDMEQVAVRVSKLYLESKNWAEKFGLPTDFSVSMAPR